MNLKLLPQKFRLYGILIALVPFISLLIVKLMNTQSLTENKAFLIKVVQVAALLGLLVVALSKEKTEDEFIMNCRYWAFTFAFIVFIINSASKIILESSVVSDKTIFRLAFSNLIVYILVFHLFKAGILHFAKQR
jgi:hypothetical protein